MDKSSIISLFDFFHLLHGDDMRNLFPLVGHRRQPFDLLAVGFHLRKYVHLIGDAIDFYAVIFYGIDCFHNGLRRAADQDYSRVETSHLVFQPPFVLTEEFQKLMPADVFADVWLGLHRILKGIFGRKESHKLKGMRESDFIWRE